MCKGGNPNALKIKIEQICGIILRVWHSAIHTMEFCFGLVHIYLKNNQLRFFSGKIVTSLADIFIAPAYSRVRYRSPNFCPSVRSSVRQHLRRSLVFSTSEIAGSLKPCIVIVPDIPFKHAP